MRLSELHASKVHYLGIIARAHIIERGDANVIRVVSVIKAYHYESRTIVHIAYCKLDINYSARRNWRHIYCIIFLKVRGYITWYLPDIVPLMWEGLGWCRVRTKSRNIRKITFIIINYFIIHSAYYILIRTI